MIDQGQFENARSLLEKAIDLDLHGKITIKAQELIDEL
jgi:hypothetical protein